MARDTARGIIIHEDRILLIERWRRDRHYFSVPGGGIEPNETPEQTVVREIAEETGCAVSIARKLYILNQNDGTSHHIFLCSYVSGEPHLPADSPEALKNEADNRFEPCWVELSALPNTPFLVWQPIKERLLHDLVDGFLPEVEKFSENVIP